MSAPSIWIVVLNWNGLEDTVACVESLRGLCYAEATIVVIDNGSTDGSASALRAAAADGAFRLVETGRNLGFAGGNNVGIRQAVEGGADFVLVLNNDTLVEPTLLDELIDVANRHPAAGCFGPWIYYMHDPERLWWTRSDWDPVAGAFTAPGKNRLASELPRQLAATEYVCGAALFFRVDVARRIGLLDERFFLVYEDSDWCFRARRAGFECISVPSARVWHKVGTSFGSEESPLRTYFSTRNKLLWAERNVSRRELFRLLRGAIGRVLPDLTVARADGVPLRKALVWAMRGFIRDCLRRARDPVEVARRRGVLDYVFRRFGDCPQHIREVTRVWADARTPDGMHGAAAR